MKRRKMDMNNRSISKVVVTVTVAIATVTTSQIDGEENAVVINGNQVPSSSTSTTVEN